MSHPLLTIKKNIKQILFYIILITFTLGHRPSPLGVIPCSVANHVVPPAGHVIPVVAVKRAPAPLAVKIRASYLLDRPARLQKRTGGPSRWKNVGEFSK